MLFFNSSTTLLPSLRARDAVKSKGSVTQPPITRLIKMHALDWLNERGRILRGAFQPIEGVHFYRSRYRGLCDRALMMYQIEMF